MPSLEAVAVAMWNCLCVRTPSSTCLIQRPHISERCIASPSTLSTTCRSMSCLARCPRQSFVIYMTLHCVCFVGGAETVMHYHAAPFSR